MKHFFQKLLKFTLALNFIFLSYQLSAQAVLEANCVWHWNPDKDKNPISTTISPSSIISASSGFVNLSIEFWDLDSKKIDTGTTCNAPNSGGTYIAEVVGYTSYDLLITITSKNASLNSVDNMAYSKKQVFYIKIFLQNYMTVM